MDTTGKRRHGLITPRAACDHMARPSRSLLFPGPGEEETQDQSPLSPEPRALCGRGPSLLKLDLLTLAL